MSIHLILGPCGSNKTSALLNILRNEPSENSVLIKHKYDKIHILPEALSVSEIYEDVEKMLGVRNKQTSFIAIVDGHFFSNIYECAHQWSLNGKHVIISAIQSGIFLDPIEHICSLLVIADKISLRTNPCVQCGCKAFFNYRIKSIPTESLYDPIATYYGDKNEYITLCRRCYHKRLKYEKENSIGLFATAIPQYYVPQIEKLLGFTTDISTFVPE